MLFNTLKNRREILKSATILAAGMGITSTAIVSAQTPASTPALENTGEYTSAEGQIALTWDVEAWELWETDDNSVVIGSYGDGSTPYAYRFRCVLSERQWENGEAGLESYQANGSALSGDDVTVIATHADETTMGYIRRSDSPGGEAYNIFEFLRVSEDEELWVSSECWIHVDQFDAEASRTQIEALMLNDHPIPYIWTLDEAIQLIAESAG